LLGSATRLDSDAESVRHVTVSALLLLSVGVGLLLGGCGSGGPRPIVTEIQPFTPEEQVAWDQASTAEYRMRKGDIFDVYFKFYPEMDLKALSVLPDGRVSLPYIDTTMAEGLTVSALDSVITDKYAEEYLDPDLSLVIRSFGEFSVYVFGQVVNPGSVVIPYEHSNLLQILAKAGGFTGDAAKSEVLLVRVTPGGYLYRRLDLSHLEKRPFMTPEFLDLQPYDVIYVPQSAIGDLTYFRTNVLGTVLSVADLFWDIYAITNLDKVDRLIR
jgi:protein involved in polysaccharide export with SLBB domain